MDIRVAEDVVYTPEPPTRDDNGFFIAYCFMHAVRRVAVGQAFTSALKYDDEYYAACPDCRGIDKQGG